MSKLKHIGLLIIIGVLSACVDSAIEYNKMCSTWLGAPESALIQGWGTPIRTYDIEDIKYITFSDSRIVSLPGTSPSYHTTFTGYSAHTTAVGGTSPTTLQLWCETTFTIHNHTVIDYRFDGNNCVAPIEESPDYTPMSVASEVF